MAHSYDKAFEISDDGMLITGGVHILSGSVSPVGVIGPTNPTRFFQTDGAIFFHTGVGGSSDWLEETAISVTSTAIDLVITTQEFIRVTGGLPVTLTLPAVGTKKITIKNSSSAIVTILPASGTVNDESNIQLKAKNPGGLGNSIDLLFEGGQFWVV